MFSSILHLQEEHERTHKNEDCKDEWIWKDEVTLVRVHKTPRRIMFVPKEADFLPCRLKRFRDDRETYQVFQSSGRTINDSWRLAGNNIERTNKKKRVLDRDYNFQDHFQC